MIQLSLIVVVLLSFIVKTVLSTSVFSILLNCELVDEMSSKEETISFGSILFLYEVMRFI